MFVRLYQYIFSGRETCYYDMIFLSDSGGQPESDKNSTGL